jgi:low affinity Fe/Cu permease
MEYQVLFNIAVAIAGFFGGWILNNIYRSLERLDADVRAMPLNYVTREDYRSDVREIKDMLGKIFDRLDTKVDK